MWPEMAAPILRAPGICWFFFCWKAPMPINFLVLGGLAFLEGGGRSVDFILMGAGMFLAKVEFE